MDVKLIDAKLVLGHLCKSSVDSLPPDLEMWGYDMQFIGYEVQHIVY